MRALITVLAATSLLVCAPTGCKSGEDGGKDKSGDKSSDRDDDRDRGDQDRGDRGDRRGGGDDGPWPPPGVSAANKAPPPPEVQKLMEMMVAAYNKRDANVVKKLFITRMAFMAVSECKPADVVDRVLDGAKQNGERARRDGGKVAFKGFKDGYLLDVKKGDKPAECRAKKAVKLYLTKFDWEIGGRTERGEAHFLFSDGVWFFVKL